MSSILVHCCCAPCASASVKSLSAEGERPFLFFMNPNIHPYVEFSARAASFREYLAATGLEGSIDDRYGLMDFINRMPGLEKPARCGYCYETRFMAAAKAAAEGSIGRFTTTLTISPYQDHEMIKSAGEKAAKQFAVEFVYRDFRPLYGESRSISRIAGYYMQKYCGCVFSEAERYDPACKVPR